MIDTRKLPRAAQTRLTRSILINKKKKNGRQKEKHGDLFPIARFRQRLKLVASVRRRDVPGFVCINVYPINPINAKTDQAI